MAITTLRFNRKVGLQIKGKGPRKIAPLPFAIDAPSQRRTVRGAKKTAAKKSARA